MFRETEGLNDEELIGALTVQLELARKQVVEMYETEEDDED